jgi:hypothetical protein
MNLSFGCPFLLSAMEVEIVICCGKSTLRFSIVYTPFIPALNCTIAKVNNVGRSVAYFRNDYQLKCAGYI